jgi:hypothetical protein
MLTRKNLVSLFHFLCRLSLVAPFWPTLVLLLASSSVPFSSIVSMRHSHSRSVEWGSKAAVSRPARGETDCFFFEQTIVYGALRIGALRRVFFKIDAAQGRQEGVFSPDFSLRAVHKYQLLLMRSLHKKTDAKRSHASLLFVFSFRRRRERAARRKKENSPPSQLSPSSSSSSSSSRSPLRKRRSHARRLLSPPQSGPVPRLRRRSRSRRRGSRQGHGSRRPALRRRRVRPPRSLAVAALQGRHALHHAQVERYHGPCGDLRRPGQRQWDVGGKE